MDAVSRLEGTTCIDVREGTSAGSIIALDFEERSEEVGGGGVASERRVSSLFIWCVWRIESDSRVIGCCWDDAARMSRTKHLLREFVGQRVVGRPTMSIPGLDLALRFGKGPTLRVFCDSPEIDTENYSIFLADRVVTVGYHSAISVKRSES